MDNRTIEVDISNEVCSKYDFTSGEIFKRPDGMKAKIIGVAPNNDGVLVPWYEIEHPKTLGRVCCHEKGSLKDAGFLKL